MRRILSFAIGLFLLSILVGLGSEVQAQQTKQKTVKKGPAVRIAVITATPSTLRPKLVGRSIGRSFKHLGQGVLGLVVEPVVDGIHDTFYMADKAFDVLSLQGRLPVLDQVYALVSVTSDDTGKLDDLLDTITGK